MRKVGVGLVVAAYVLLLYTSLSAPAYARAHSNLDPAFLAAYAAPWPVALACTLVVSGVVLALIPLRRGQRWAWWTLLAMLAICFFTRTLTDPRCFVVLDPHQHGCHTFVIASLLEVIGLALTWR
jgi:nicotinamide riboside transporter PnuC